MRLSAEEVAAIKAAAAAAFGPDAVVRLFGSRVHDHLRGGDTDLHVEWAGGDEWRARDVFFERLFERVEPSRVDLVFTQRGAVPEPIERIALRDGLVL